MQMETEDRHTGVGTLQELKGTEGGDVASVRNLILEMTGGGDSLPQHMLHTLFIRCYHLGVDGVSSDSVLAATYLLITKFQKSNQDAHMHLMSPDEVHQSIHGFMAHAKAAPVSRTSNSNASRIPIKKSLLKPDSLEMNRETAKSSPSVTRKLISQLMIRRSTTISQSTSTKRQSSSFESSSIQPTLSSESSSIAFPHESSSLSTSVSQSKSTSNPQSSTFQLDSSVSGSVDTTSLQMMSPKFHQQIEKTTLTPSSIPKPSFQPKVIGKSDQLLTTSTVMKLSNSQNAPTINPEIAYAIASKPKSTHNKDEKDEKVAESDGSFIFESHGETVSLFSTSAPDNLAEFDVSGCSLETDVQSFRVSSVDCNCAIFDPETRFEEFLEPVAVAAKYNSLASSREQVSPIRTENMIDANVNAILPTTVGSDDNQNPSCDFIGQCTAKTSLEQLVEIVTPNADHTLSSLQEPTVTMPQAAEETTMDVNINEYSPINPSTVDTDDESDHGHEQIYSDIGDQRAAASQLSLLRRRCQENEDTETYYTPQSTPVKAIKTFLHGQGGGVSTPSGTGRYGFGGGSPMPFRRSANGNKYQGQGMKVGVSSNSEYGNHPHHQLDSPNLGWGTATDRESDGLLGRTSIGSANSGNGGVLTVEDLDSFSDEGSNMKEMGKVIRDLRHKLKSAERHLDAMAVSSKKTIDDLKFEADGAKGEIVAFRRILSEHRTVEKDLTGKVETYEKLHMELQRELDQTKKHNSNLKHLNTNHEYEIAVLKNDYAEASSQLSVMQSHQLFFERELTKKSVENEELRTKINNLHEEVVKTEEMFVSLTKDNLVLKRKIDTAEAFEEGFSFGYHDEISYESGKMLMYDDLSGSGQPGGLVSCQTLDMELATFKSLSSAGSASSPKITPTKKPAGKSPTLAHAISPVVTSRPSVVHGSVLENALQSTEFHANMVHDDNVAASAICVDACTWTDVIPVDKTDAKTWIEENSMACVETQTESGTSTKEEETWMEEICRIGSETQTDMVTCTEDKETGMEDRDFRVPSAETQTDVIRVTDNETEMDDGSVVGIQTDDILRVDSVAQTGDNNAASEVQTDPVSMMNSAVQVLETAAGIVQTDVVYTDDKETDAMFGIVNAGVQTDSRSGIVTTDTGAGAEMNLDVAVQVSVDCLAEGCQTSEGGGAVMQVGLWERFGKGGGIEEGDVGCLYCGGGTLELAAAEEKVRGLELEMVGLLAAVGEVKLGMSDALGSISRTTNLRKMYDEEVERWIECVKCDVQSVKCSTEKVLEEVERRNELEGLLKVSVDCGNKVSMPKNPRPATSVIAGVVLVAVAIAAGMALKNGVGGEYGRGQCLQIGICGTDDVGRLIGDSRQGVLSKMILGKGGEGVLPPQ